MTNTRIFVASAVAAVTTLAGLGAALAQSSPTPAPVPSYEFEKCYGVVAAGKNDCQTATHSCAGTATRDNQGDSWLYLPAGSCSKITGGSPVPKA